MEEELKLVFYEIYSLKEEVKYLRDQIDILKGKEHYEQILTKYTQPVVEKKIDHTIELDGKKYTIDSNNQLWDENGYFSGIAPDLTHSID